MNLRRLNEAQLPAKHKIYKGGLLQPQKTEESNQDGDVSEAVIELKKIAASRKKQLEDIKKVLHETQAQLAATEEQLNKKIDSAENVKQITEIEIVKILSATKQKGTQKLKCTVTVNGSETEQELDVTVTAQELAKLKKVR